VNKWLGPGLRLGLGGLLKGQGKGQAFCALALGRA